MDPDTDRPARDATSDQDQERQHARAPGNKHHAKCTQQGEPSRTRSSERWQFSEQQTGNRVHASAIE
jgi:hypothetical protein